MDRIDEYPGGISRPAMDKPRGRKELIQWMTDYRASVGPAADGCEQLSLELLDSGVLSAAALDSLLELLDLLRMLPARKNRSGLTSFRNCLPRL
jgi:hypothetical protein